MTDPRWLDERESRSWRSFLRMHARLINHLNRQLQRDSGLSVFDYEVLVYLAEARDQGLRSFELARSMQWEKSRLSHHLTRMQGRGLVTREECTTDARGAFIVLTQTGREAIGAAAPMHVEEARRCFFDALSPDQLDELAEVSEAVLAKLAIGDE